MRVLIVEDDRNKRRQIVAFIAASFPQFTIDERESYQSGLKAIVADPPALVLLDMSMPTFDLSTGERGGRMRFYAGRDILRELKRKKVATEVIVVTQFETFGEGSQRTTLEELKDELAREFPSSYRGTVYYHPARSDWKAELQRSVISIILSQGDDRDQHSSS